MQQEFIEEDRNKDFANNWVSSSKFIWLCQVFLVIAFLIGASYALYVHRYKGKPSVQVPENTLYNPKYK